MKIIAPENSVAREGKVRRKANNTRKLRANTRKQLNKTVMGAPEVMAKVTGFSKGGRHARSNLEYISRNGNVELENERGEVIKGGKELKEFAKSWTDEMPEPGGRRKPQRDTMHLVLSMPQGTPPEAVKEATRAFAKRTFGNHEYVFALHTPENDPKSKQPHCHLTVKCRGLDGKVLNPRKADLQRYREAFAQAMEEQGIAANATRRQTRGVVKKAVKQVLIHLEQRGASKVKALKVKEVAEELKAEAKGVKPEPKPWIQRIEEKQARIRSAWKALADALSKSNESERKIGHDRPDYSRAGRAGARAVRPDYSSADRERIGAIQRRVARVHESYAGSAARRGAPASTFASLRDLPGVNVVRDERRSEMLLHADARSSVEPQHGRAADSDVRRARTGVDSHERGRLEVAQASKDRQGNAPYRVDDKTLSKAIRGLLERMPSVETERDQLKRELGERFARQQRKQDELGRAPGSGVEAVAGVSAKPTEPDQKPESRQDLER